MKKDFCEFLKDLDHGRVVEECGEELRRVVKAVRETGGTGKLVLTLNVKNESMRAAVEPKLDVKEPRHKMQGSLFFFDNQEEGGLVREDPKQMTLKALPERQVKDGVE